MKPGVGTVMAAAMSAGPVPGSGRARRFVEFVLGPAGQERLAAFGFSSPD
jgi:ABC-type Fe3+ transport system substrate-binding protein